MQRHIVFCTVFFLGMEFMRPNGIAQPTGAMGGPYGLERSLQAFNPAISVIVDLFYRQDDSEEGIAHVLEGLSGFGHIHGHAHHDHAHGAEKGFNLRHVEIQLSADVDPYFKGSAIVGVDTERAELEVAEIETSHLPWGFKLKGGKFYSDFGYLNAQHSHQWDFIDRPLIFQLVLGEHGLNDKGLQLSWLAPAPFYLLSGVEVFQGNNETAFAYHGEDPLPIYDGPRLGVGWLKFGPDLPGAHGVQIGFSAGVGRHQEAHDGDADGDADHWLDGTHAFWGADAVYKFNAPKPYGQGDITLQAEYLFRRKDLELIDHTLRPELVGNSLVKKQDGYYIQAVYGVLPRWRIGTRFEQVGLKNQDNRPNGEKVRMGASSRAALMLDFTPSEFSRIRLQANQGAYKTEEGKQDVTEVGVQWMVSLGAHGAHKF